MALRRMILRSGLPKLRRILAEIYGAATEGVSLRSLNYSVAGFSVASITHYAAALVIHYAATLVTHYATALVTHYAAALVTHYAVTWITSYSGEE